jgi:arylsulfatase A-like enzyme
VPAARAIVLSGLAAPGLIAIGHQLFTGGKMAQLPANGALQAAVALALIAGLGGAIVIVSRLEQHARTRRARRGLALSAVFAGFALGKADQLVMPGLYAYLHAALAAAAFGCHAAALSWLLPDLARYARRRYALGIAGLCVLMLVSTLFALDDNQNVRVALQHPNASTTRSLMLGLGPLVLEPMQRRAFAEARQRLRARRAADTRQTTRPVVVDGPRFEDAHVLLITVDALRPDHLGSYGYARKTSPGLDALAAESLVFERAYAPAPHSSYSLCSIMTSEYLHETLDLGHPAPRETLATALAAVGYHTAAFFTLGVFHTAGEKLRDYEKNALGFSLHDHVAYEADALTDRVLSEIDRTLSRGEPSTLLWAHYFDVHEPYEDTRFGSSDLDRYDGEINKADAAIDRLIREARKRFTRELIIVVTADHGEEFREHGGVYHGSTLYEEQIRVPLIIQVPGAAPRRIAAPVETLALAPTVLGLVGVAVPRTMRGDDLRPLFAGKDLELGPAFAAVIHKKMVVRWPHKLIADLRFGLFELYDLAADPHERENLAGSEPALRDALRDEVYGWLDTLTPPAPGSPADAAAAADPRLAALDLGRLGDRRAVQPLVALAADARAPLPERLQAAKMLGHLADATSANALALMLEDSDASLAAEAAIALGRMFDQRAKNTLRRVVASEDPDVRTRAAVSLGRLRDRAAVPALIEALWLAPREYEREEAVRWLGRLGDTQALDPLLQILPESRTRHLAVIAIGRLRDPRAFDALASVLAVERLSDVRSATVQGFGYLGDPRAIELIAPLAATDASLSTATESLVRLGAIRRGVIGGVDLVRGDPSLRGFGACEAGDPWHDWDYLHRTYCTTTAAHAALRIELSQQVVEQPSVVVISARRSDKSAPVQVHLTIGKHALPAFTIDGSWTEARVELPGNTLSAGRSNIALEIEVPDARIDLDHVLVLPKAR